MPKFQITCDEKVDVCSDCVPKVGNICCCQKCEMEYLSGSKIEVNDNKVYIDSCDIKKFINDYNEIFPTPILDAKLIDQ